MRDYKYVAKKTQWRAYCICCNWLGKKEEKRQMRRARRRYDRTLEGQ